MHCRVVDCCDACRFATVSVGSENSSRLIFDKLVQKDLHGMLPSVSYYTASSLARLDPTANKKDSSGGGTLYCVSATAPGCCPSLGFCLVGLFSKIRSAVAGLDLLQTSVRKPYEY